MTRDRFHSLQDSFVTDPFSSQKINQLFSQSLVLEGINHVRAELTFFKRIYSFQEAKKYICKKL